MASTLSIPTTLILSLSALSPDCDLSASPLQCRLDNLLNFLDVAAAILGVVLVLVLVVAWRSWQQNRKSLPHSEKHGYRQHGNQTRENRNRDSEKRRS